MKDDHLYLEVTKEVTDGKLDKALWAKAIAKAMGDMEQGKYEYINLRVEQLKATAIEKPQSSGDERFMPPGSRPEQQDDQGEEFVVTDDDEPAANESSSDEVANAMGGINKFIEGRYGLAVTFWGFGVGFNILATIILIAVNESASASALLWFSVVIIACQIGIWIAIWSAANLYQGRSIWAGLAKVSVVFGILRTLGEFASTYNP